MGADVLAALNPQQKRELFSRLFMNRSELRLVVFDAARGHMPAHDPAINAILRLPNTVLTPETAYENAAKIYGIPKAWSILFLTPGQDFRSAPGVLLKAVLLKQQIGEFEFARLLAANNGIFPGVHEKNGVFEPPQDLLATISQEALASLVVAYAA